MGNGCAADDKSYMKDRIEVSRTRLGPVDRYAGQSVCNPELARGLAVALRAESVELMSTRPTARVSRPALIEL